MRSVKERAPVNSVFSGKAIHYAYTDAKRVRKHLLRQFDDALLKADEVEFVLAVRAFGHYGGVSSLWVYFGTFAVGDSVPAE
mmetsp:Transcript_29123/g.62643  ORF Transcript_29123/g.62643 Transcript_29123/m.62643 type:complete len:82 (+) Transcript_29123:3-248(+)